MAYFTALYQHDDLGRPTKILSGYLDASAEIGIQHLCIRIALRLAAPPFLVTGLF
jgi:hypothetical protein